MHHTRAYFLIFSFFLFQIYSCKKDKDTSAPQISVSSPIVNQFYNVYDNISVSASVTDDVKLTQVSLTLVNADFIPAGPAVSFASAAPHLAINYSYYLDDIHLESGLYYLLFSASDGTNDSKMYRAVNIGAVPKKLTKIVVSTNSNSSVTNLSYIDSSFSVLNFYHAFSGDHLGTSASSYYQQVFTCGNYTGNYTSLLLADNSTKFSVPAVPSSAPYFTAYYSEDKKNYIGFYDERIKGYDNNGNVIYSANANSGYYARKMIMNGSSLIAEEKNKTSAGKILVSFYSTGTAMQQTAVTQDVAAFCEKNADNVFVFGNVSGQGVIQLYDRINNNLWNPYGYALAAGSILSAVKIDEDTYLFGHSNGTIYKYQFQTSNVTVFLSGYTANKLKYDALNNTIYLAETSRIVKIDYASKTFLNAVNAAENILDFDLLYNR